MKLFFAYTQLVSVAVLLWIIIIQGNTIAAQRRVIKDMTRNPQCLIP
jgi:hypothetical protein